MYGGVYHRRRTKRHHSPPPPQLHRPTPPQSSSISISGDGKNVEEGESYDLVSGRSGDFAMIIRLDPNMKDEIKRLEEEEEGGVAKIKFGSNANTPLQNVIVVGGKEFRFTWSHEQGDLCDIYEERQSGENGDGLLVECGGAWRKLTMQRVLDESTKNHVKMRSKEAERQLKSRKTIILGNGRPSSNNHMKASITTAVEVNTGRMVPKLKKEPPFKRQKVGPTQASGCPPRPVIRPGLSSTTTVKGRLSVAPVTSPQEKSRPSASPFGLGNLLKGQKSAEDVISPKMTYKEKVSNPEIEVPTRVHAAVPAQRKKGWKASPLDLRSKLITLLVENPKGLNFKALEKAVGDPTMKIKPVLEKIATYQSPGRYILKEGLELESFKKSSSNSGSFSECIPDQASNSNLKKASPDKSDLQSQLSRQSEVSNLVEKIDTQHNYHGLVRDKKASEHSEEHTGSSCESGSDSDSGTSSENGSGSGSSSDSDSDGSLSNTEGSDVEVNIMISDDEKEKMDHIVQNPEPGSEVDVNIMSSADEKNEMDHTVQHPESRISTSPLPSKTEDQNELNGLNENKQAGQVSRAIGSSKESLNETGFVDTTDSTPLRANVRSSRETIPISPVHKINQGESLRIFAGSLINKGNDTKDGYLLSSGTEYLDEKSESARMEGGWSVQPPITGGNKDTMLAQSPSQEPFKDQTLQALDRVGDTPADKGLERGVPSMVGRSHLDSLQSSQKHAEIRTTVNAHDMMQGPKISAQNPGHGSKTFGAPSFPDESDGLAFRSANDKFSTTRDNVNRETPDEDSYAYEKSSELRGSIKNFSQYKEYVEEYRKKYDSYSSLHRQLKAYRNDFSKLGQDLQDAKARGMEEYYAILKQLIEKYRQCGSKYKRMKKIFIILHEELKCLKKRVEDFAVSNPKD